MDEYDQRITDAEALRKHEASYAARYDAELIARGERTLEIMQKMLDDCREVLGKLQSEVRPF